MAKFNEFIENSVGIIALVPSNELIEMGYGGLHNYELIPLVLPKNVKLIEKQDPRYAEGYRYDVSFKEIPGETANDILDESLSMYYKTLRSQGSLDDLKK